MNNIGKPTFKVNWSRCKLLLLAGPHQATPAPQGYLISNHTHTKKAPLGAKASGCLLALACFLQGPFYLDMLQRATACPVWPSVHPYTIPLLKQSQHVFLPRHFGQETCSTPACLSCTCLYAYRLWAMGQSPATLADSLFAQQTHSNGATPSPRSTSDRERDKAASSVPEALQP